jgi:phosphoserine phosphatase
MLIKLNIEKNLVEIWNTMLVIFDVEGVLYDAEFLPLLAEKMNKEKEVWEITKKGIQGKIDWEEGLRQRVELLKGLDYKTCKDVADSMPIMTGAKELCSALKNAGWKLMAVSGGFTIITDRLKTELGIDHIFTNELVFNDEKLDDVVVNVNADKSKSAISKITEWNETKENTTVIVDGANDVKLFDISDLGIAFRAQDLVKDLATVTLDEKDLTKIIPIINNHYNLTLSV